MFESIHPQLALVKTILVYIGSVAGTSVVVRTLYREFVPFHIQSSLSNRLSKLLSRLFSSELTLVIGEFHGLGSNEYYEAPEVCLGTKIPPHSYCL